MSHSQEYHKGTKTLRRRRFPGHSPLSVSYAGCAASPVRRDQLSPCVRRGCRASRHLSGEAAEPSKSSLWHHFSERKDLPNPMSSCICGFVLDFGAMQRMECAPGHAEVLRQKVAAISREQQRTTVRAASRTRRRGTALAISRPGATGVAPSHGSGSARGPVANLCWRDRLGEQPGKPVIALAL
jgi:hypothetical protein